MISKTIANKVNIIDVGHFQVCLPWKLLLGNHFTLGTVQLLNIILT